MKLSSWIAAGLIAGTLIPIRFFGRRNTDMIGAMMQGHAAILKASLPPTPMETFKRSIAHLALTDQNMLIREFERARGNL